ncbi:hypothetical protein [Phycicoccus avicenniae]|uniref:hypothetical protein n=1 Tax=Phycicoccus avicenniae TaxID=2828860 RepID=UPI003D29E418
MSDRPGEMDERDVDARFASIVAAWDGPSSPGDDVAGTAGPTEDLDSPAEPADDAEPAPARPPWVNPSPLDIVVPASSWRAAETSAEEGSDVSGADPVADEEEDEHFEPPAVELPPQEDLHFWGAVLGLVAGPLCLIYVAMARPFHSTRWFLAGLVLSLGGFALLVLRQPRHRDEDDDGVRL